MSVFSLGTMRCLDGSQVFQDTLARALALGINHLETAPSYGPSEVYLGQTLRTIAPPRDRLILTSKLLPQGGEIEGKIRQSLDRLGLDYLDCLAIHGLNTGDHWQWVQTHRRELQRLQKAGLFRHLGFSSHGDQKLIRQAMESNFFSFVNLHYYYFFPHHQPLLDLAVQQDLGIFIISPTDKGGQLYQPPDRLRQLCDPLEPMGFNFRFLLGDPRVTTLSFGAAQPEDLDAILPWLDATFPPTDQEKVIDIRLQTTLRDTLKGDLCSQCYQCLPCPEAVAIPEILRLRNLAIAYDMSSYGEYRYQMLEKAGHWFPGRRGDRCTDCGDCLPRCPEKLEIPRLLHDAHDRFKGPGRRRLWEEETEN